MASAHRSPTPLKGETAAVAPSPQVQGKAGGKRGRRGEGKDIRFYLYGVVKVIREEGRGLKAGSD